MPFVELDVSSPEGSGQLLRGARCSAQLVGSELSRQVVAVHHDGRGVWMEVGSSSGRGRGEAREGPRLGLRWGSFIVAYVMSRRCRVDSVVW